MKRSRIIRKGQSDAKMGEPTKGDHGAHKVEEPQKDSLAPLFHHQRHPHGRLKGNHMNPPQFLTLTTPRNSQNNDPKRPADGALPFPQDRVPGLRTLRLIVDLMASAIFWYVRALGFRCERWAQVGPMNSRPRIGWIFGLRPCPKYQQWRSFFLGDLVRNYSHGSEV